MKYTKLSTKCAEGAMPLEADLTIVGDEIKTVEFRAPDGRAVRIEASSYGSSLIIGVEERPQHWVVSWRGMRHTPVDSEEAAQQLRDDLSTELDIATSEFSIEKA